MTAGVKSSATQQAQRLQHHKALAHPVRLAIYERVALKEYSVGDLADAFPLSRWAVQKHIAILARAGLIERRREGRFCWIGRSQHSRLN